MPVEFNEHPFSQAFAQAELSALSSAEAEAYRDSLKVYRDNLNIGNTRFDEGKMEGKRDTARLMLAEGESLEKIIRFTGLASEDIEQL